MDMSTAAVIIVSIITAPVCGLLGLWLRLRWRARHEHTRGQTLTRVTEVLAEGGQVELDQQWGEGDQLRVKITCPPARRKNTAA